jgi:hypothetical protein
MDEIFFDRFHLKIEQHLSSIGTPSPQSGGLDPFIELHLDANGKMFEDILSFIRRYWERARPGNIEELGEAQEVLLLYLLKESQDLLAHTIQVYEKAYPNITPHVSGTKIEFHYKLYSSKVRDEIAFLKAVRKREVADDRQKWIFGAAIPVACAVLSVVLAGDAVSTLKEINVVRREIAEIAKASLITTELVLDGEGRFGGMPAHKAAARKRLKLIEERLREFYPDIHRESEAEIGAANAEAKLFWEKYRTLPPDKRSEYRKKYESAQASGGAVLKRAGK